MDYNYKETVKIFKALSDETRLKILVILKGGEKCACRLLEELEIGQSTLSHHMKILCDSGIVTSRKEGKWSYYSVDKGVVVNIKEMLDNFTKIESLENDKCN